METQNTSRSAMTERRVVILVHSAIAGACLAAALELASREIYPPLLLFSLGSFAIAIPAALTLVILAATIVGFLALRTVEKGLRETARASTAARNAEAINE